MIEFKKSEYHVTEEGGVVNVEVVRHGNLNQYAIVMCAPHNGTAYGSFKANKEDYLASSGQVTTEYFRFELFIFCI